MTIITLLDMITGKKTERKVTRETKCFYIIESATGYEMKINKKNKTMVDDVHTILIDVTQEAPQEKKIYHVSVLDITCNEVVYKNTVNVTPGDLTIYIDNLYQQFTDYPVTIGHDENTLTLYDVCNDYSLSNNINIHSRMNAYTGNYTWHKANINDIDILIGYHNLTQEVHYVQSSNTTLNGLFI